LVSFWCGDFVVLLHTNSILGWPYCSDPKLNLESRRREEEFHDCTEELQQQRGQILSDSLRSRGGPVKVGEAIQCRLTLQLRTPARIGDVSVRIPFVGQQAGG
jgi:hypothetical protein